MKRPKSRVDGAKLRRLREEMGLTIEELADDTAKRARPENKKGVSAKTIGRMEHNGHAYPYTIKRVADALGIEPKDLLIEKPVIGFLSEYLCDFKDFMEDRTEGFVGRKFVFDAIDEFIEHNECGYFFVLGDPGIGKSAVTAHLVKNRKYIHHFNIRAEGINRAETFLRNICAQLVIRFELPYQMLSHDVEADGKFLSTLLKEASEKLAGEERVIILVDALDEVEESSRKTGANILFLPPRIPKGVFFIITARPQSYQLRLECRRGEFTIEHDDSDNLGDIEEYLMKRVTSARIKSYIKKQNLSTQDFISVMKNRSEGNFMYLRYVLPEIEEGAYKDLEFGKLPFGLQNYYEDHWRRMGMMAKPLPERKIKIVYVLSEVREPVSRAFIVEVTGERELHVQEVLDEWTQFLHHHSFEGEERFSVYHSSFNDFLNRKEIVQVSGVSIQDINALIVDGLLRLYDGDTLDQSD